MRMDKRIDQESILNNINILHGQVTQYIERIDFSNKKDVRELFEKISEIVYLWLLIKHDIKRSFPDQSCTLEAKNK